MTRWIAQLLPLLGLVLLPAANAKPGDGPPKGQKDLVEWWRAAQDLWLGEDAYQAAGIEFKDGVCKAKFEDGIVIPVYSGKPPLSERVVGVLFVGNGGLEVGFPQRGDAWGFANHMVATKEKKPEEVRGIARSGEPYKVKIDRAMILSADPSVERMLLNRMPVGSGTYRTEKGKGEVDEEYVVTQKRGKFKAKMISTNILPQRTLRLAEAGLDARAMIRQDRLLYETLKFPGAHLRAVADFRTLDRFHVAALDGSGVGPSDHDKWMTCFRDGLGQSDVGGRAIAFTHGEDLEGKRHFKRISGEQFPQKPSEVVGRPAVMMQPVSADSRVEIRPVERRNYQQVSVESLLTVRAGGAALQHVALRLPTSRAEKGSFKLLSVTDADGKDLPWVGLHADEKFFQAKSESVVDNNEETTQIEEGVESQDVTQGGLNAPDLQGLSVGEGGLGGGGGGGGGSPDVGESNSQDGPKSEIIGTPLTMQTKQEVSIETVLFRETAFRYEILVLLPQPVAKDQETQIRVKWQAKWRYSNLSNARRQLGPTTGLQPFLPELLPSPGGTVWKTKTRFGIPPRGIWTSSGAVSGITTEKKTGEDGWRWVTAVSDHARRASVGVGKWSDHSEPSAKEMPGVKVHLLTGDAWGLQEFPPEIRRVVTFLERFLPKYPETEVELYQSYAGFAPQHVAAGWHKKASGIVGIRNIKPTDVTDAGMLEKIRKTMAQQMIARQVAHQYWGQRIGPNSTRDEWMTNALAEAYAAFYLRAAIGASHYDAWVESARKAIENPTERVQSKDLVNRRRRALSLTSSSALSDISSHLLSRYGFFIVTHQLRLRVGDQAYFRGLDRLARRRMGSWVTTEDLQAVLEETSGEDLSDFFDFWVHGGRVPAVQVYFQEVPGDGSTVVKGCIVSNQPFGSFDLPVRVTDIPDPAKPGNPRNASALVDVDDGIGLFTVPGRKGKIEVKVDPDHQLLLYKRQVIKTKALPDTCKEPAK
jgi:hypothetical protein